MVEPIVGDQQALIARILWDIRHKYTKQQSLEKWHKWSPDISDDIFEQLYDIALCRSIAMSYWNQTGGMQTIRECQQWTKHK